MDCAVLYDEENCDTSSDMLRVRPGDSGRLSKWSPFTSSLQRNDLESLIVRAHCKLELWDDDDGIDNNQPPDIVIDNTVTMQIFSDVTHFIYMFSSFLSQDILIVLKILRPSDIWMRVFQLIGDFPSKRAKLFKNL